MIWQWREPEDKADINNGNIDNVKKVAQKLMAKVKQRRHEMGDLHHHASVPAQMTAIIDRLPEGMPKGYFGEDIGARAEVVFQNVQPNQSVTVQ